MRNINYVEILGEIRIRIVSFGEKNEKIVINVIRAC